MRFLRHLAPLGLSQFNMFARRVWGFRSRRLTLEKLDKRRGEVFPHIPQGKFPHTFPTLSPHFPHNFPDFPEAMARCLVHDIDFLADTVPSNLETDDRAGTFRIVCVAPTETGKSHLITALLTRLKAPNLSCSLSMSSSRFAVLK